MLFKRAISSIAFELTHHLSMNKTLSIAAILTSFVLASCKTDIATQAIDYNSTFGQLEQKVFAKNCTGCHTSGTDYALQSNLILDPFVAYENLVGVKSHYLNASNDGLLRVKAGDADNSFLFQKLHGFPSEKEYGLRMPLGIPQLTVGQQEYIRRWINGGAPKTGFVTGCDAALLNDTTASPSIAFTPLDPPAPGTGYQVSTGKFDINSNFEREIFMYRDLGNTAPVYINHFHTKMRPNSHHLVIYSFSDSTPSYLLPQMNALRDLRNPDGSYDYTTEEEMNWHNFLGGSMIQEDDYHFPAGVALKLPAHAGIDLNSHFVNYGTTTLQGEAYANLYTVDPTKVQYEAQTLLVPYTNITLPPHQQKVLTSTTTNPYPVKANIFMLTSHYHERGQKFQIQITGGKRNGEIIYESSDWSHPVEKIYDPPIVLNQGEGITSIVTYFNNTDHTIGYGLKSTDEMDVIYGYYYVSF
jgi:hypothetical protein